MKIVVTGSLGHIGKPLTQELLRQGHMVSVISANTEKRDEIQALGAVAVIGSVEDAKCLETAFQGADAVYLMVPPNFSEPDSRAWSNRVGEQYVQAIKASGVKRVVHLSSYGADLPEGTGLILGAHDLEIMLNGLEGVSVTHLRPGYFYYNLEHFIEMIKGMNMIGANYGGEDHLVMAAPEDIALAAAEELSTSESRPHVRYVASDDRPASEVARILGAAIGKPDLAWMVFSDEQTRDAMLARQMPASFVHGYVELGAALHSGKLRGDYDANVPPTFGKTKIEDYAHQFAQAYHG